MSEGNQTGMVVKKYNENKEDENPKTVSVSAAQRQKWVAAGLGWCKIGVFPAGWTVGPVAVRLQLRVRQCTFDADRDHLPLFVEHRESNRINGFGVHLLLSLLSRQT